MMLDVLLTNRDAVLEWLAAYAGRLGEALETMLRNGDEAALRTRLSQAQQARSAMRF